MWAARQCRLSRGCFANRFEGRMCKGKKDPWGGKSGRGDRVGFCGHTLRGARADIVLWPSMDKTRGRGREIPSCRGLGGLDYAVCRQVGVLGYWERARQAQTRADASTTLTTVDDCNARFSVITLIPGGNLSDTQKTDSVECLSKMHKGGSAGVRGGGWVRKERKKCVGGEQEVASPKRVQEICVWEQIFLGSQTLLHWSGGDRHLGT
ncbi:hypothetical protein B0H67DRAFT_42710 [Lasiosphaeris hirsuta]|uniref:Uncharacterized protein n=1 Tax=Lasiosphaeris hirsuta TaxID=260670 RepID=A0AA40BAB8_9PEZI|nr:hypothetical protein B0H67DRAFT_42710 [Lasiosphaeris hirsuta]